MPEEKIQHVCIKVNEVKEALESLSLEEKTAKIRSFLDRAGNCPLCRRAVLKAIDPSVS